MRRLRGCGVLGMMVVSTFGCSSSGDDSVAPLPAVTASVSLVNEGRQARLVLRNGEEAAVSVTCPRLEYREGAEWRSDVVCSLVSWEVAAGDSLVTVSTFPPRSTIRFRALVALGQPGGGNSSRREIVSQNLDAP